MVLTDEFVQRESEVRAWPRSEDPQGRRPANLFEKKRETAGRSYFSGSQIRLRNPLKRAFPIMKDFFSIRTVAAITISKTQLMIPK